MPHLHLSLLGTFQAQLDGKSITGFQSNKARGLLAYLAVEATQPHQRDRLAGLFWPEWSDAKARANLRHALSNLRQVLKDREAETPFLHANRQTVQFNLDSDHHLDVAQFSHCLTSKEQTHLTEAEVERLKTGVSLYTGAFLTGFFLPDCAAFEEWVLLTRERLHNQMLTALHTLTTHFEAQGAFEEALVYAQQQVVHEPVNEDGHIQLMRLLAYTGQRSAALTQYERCCQILVDELGVEPGPKTRALHHQIQRGQLKPPIPDVPKPPRQHNLPAQTTPFIGRVIEQQTICTLLRRETVRLLTLHGPGGVGKTRLGLQVAEQLQPDFEDGVYFVSLAPLRDPALVIPTIARVLNVRETGSHTLEQALKAKLQAQQTLLVLDNFEHLIAAAPIVSDLLSTAPKLKILVTSREILRLYGEYEYAVSPLEAPDDRHSTTKLAQMDAVQLFSERVLAVKPNFILDDAIAPIVAQICARLDGLPLAIELAAARVRRFSPAQLLAQLTARKTVLPLLRSGPRDLPARHQALDQAIAWSYDLLDRDEQILFRRLAVFAGGCIPEAAEAICNFDGGLALDVWEGLEALADKNLIRYIIQPDGSARSLLLETIREFGFEQLQAAGAANRVQAEHAHFYLQWVEDLQQSSSGIFAPQFLDRLELEHDNLRLALRWALANQDLEIGLGLVGILYNFWNNRGYFSEGTEWLTRVVEAAVDAPPSIRLTKALFGTGFMFNGLGDMSKAQAYYSRSLAVSRQLGDQGLIGLSLALLGNTCYS